MIKPSGSISCSSFRAPVGSHLRRFAFLVSAGVAFLGCLPAFFPLCILACLARSSARCCSSSRAFTALHLLAGLPSIIRFLYGFQSAQYKSLRTRRVSAFTEGVH